MLNTSQLKVGDYVKCCMYPKYWGTVQYVDDNFIGVTWVTNDKGTLNKCHGKFYHHEDISNTAFIVGYKRKNKITIIIGG